MWKLLFLKRNNSNKKTTVISKPFVHNPIQYFPPVQKFWFPFCGTLWAKHLQSKRWHLLWKAMRIISVSSLKHFSVFQWLWLLHGLLQKDKPWKLLDCKIAVHCDTSKPLKDKSWQPLDCKILAHWHCWISETSEKDPKNYFSCVTEWRRLSNLRSPSGLIWFTTILCWWIYI